MVCPLVCLPRHQPTVESIDEFQHGNESRGLNSATGVKFQMCSVSILRNVTARRSTTDVQESVAPTPPASAAGG